MRRLALSLLVFAATTSVAVNAAADYAAKGSVATASFDLGAGTGGATGGSLVVPTASGTYPLIIAVHGWSASSDNQLGWAEHFASYGFVVVVPDLPTPFSPDTTVNKNVLVALANTFSDPSFVSPAQGKIDATRIGIEGHSAGGLAATVASTTIKPRATVLFDPVDKANAGRNAYPSLCTPVLALFAAAGSCNQNADWSSFKTTAAGPLINANVVGATHCDGENNPRTLCGPFCGGGAATARQDVHARYATAFFLAHLKDDAAAAATLTATALAADTTLAQTSVRDDANASCGAVDGGPQPEPREDAGKSDSSASAADGGTRDAADDDGSDDDGSGPAQNPAAGTAPPSEGGCHTANGAAGSGLFGLSLALLAMLRRRRG